MGPVTPTPRLRVSAVSYLNTTPLVWGFLHGPQRDLFDISFAVPSVCADRVAAGQADIGILPVIEMHRQKLAYLPSTGIACRGTVRSILLVSTKPLRQVRTVAADTGSRTSVMLTRVLLADRYGVRPRLVPMAPDLPAMLGNADAALLIGDAALRIDPIALASQYLITDLGEEWELHTGLPMVFAVWSGRPEVIRPELDADFVGSYRYGRAHLDEIIECDARPRGFADAFAREYLTRNVVYELGAREHAGLSTFLWHAVNMENPAPMESIPVL